MGCRLNPRHPAAAKALAIYVMSQGAGQSLHDLSGHGFMMRWRDIPGFGEQMFRWNQRAGGQVITFDNGNAMSTQNGTDWTYHKSWERTRLSIVAKYRTVANATHAFVAKSEGAGGGNQKWLFYWDGDALRFLVDTAAAAAEIAVSGVWTPTLGVFHTVGVVKDGLTYTFYADRVSLGSATVANYEALPQSFSPVDLGFGETGGIGSLTDGDEEFVFLFGDRLMPSEMRSLMERPYDLIERPMARASSAGATGAVDAATVAAASRKGHMRITHLQVLYSLGGFSGGNKG